MTEGGREFQVVGAAQLKDRLPFAILAANLCTRQQSANIFIMKLYIEYKKHNMK